MKNTFLRLCSMILTIVMVIQLFPAVYAAEESTQASVQPAASLDAQQATIVEEIVENRTQYTKEFRLTGGLYMAVVYPDPVHYEKDGAWAEIDNTLKLTTDGTYTNTAGVWDVALPQQLNGSSPVTVTKDGYTLSFVLSGELNADTGAVMSQQAQLSAEALSVTQPQSVTAQPQDTGAAQAKAAAKHPQTVSDKLQSRLLYENIYANTSITYDLDSNKVKESIIMEQYNANLRGYKYNLNVGSLVPVLGQDGHIDFYNEDKSQLVMVMPAPFLIDGAYVYNDDIEVSLIGKGSTYTLTYILPQDWLSAQDRSWPVILDPEIRPSLSTGNIRDQQITENTQYTHTRQVMEAGYGANDGIERFYLKYQNLPAIGPSDVIIDAQIRLKKIGGYSAPLVEVHKVLETWESETLHWSNKAAYDPTVEDYGTAVDSSWYSWEVTDIARGWYEGENTGMMFKASDAVEQGGTAKWRQFISSDGGGSADRPTLTITFRNNNGLESYWNYTSASAGRAGTGYINDYTGNLVWVQSDIGFGGNRAPVAISHVYNANDTVATDSANNAMSTSGNAFGMGYGWRTNYNQLVYRWSTNSNYYVWEDADGTDRYFLYNAQKAAYIQEDDPNLTLKVISTGITITDKSGNTVYFDTNGRLWKSENNQATKSAVTVTYTTSSGKQIDKITDGAGRVYDFTYNADGLLSRIGYYGTGTAELSHVTYSYTNGNLTTVTDKDGKSAVYTYTGHLLTSAQDIDGYKLTYTYTKTQEGQPCRVASVSESHNGKQASSLTITYGHNQTAFTDHNGNVSVCQFNDFGNTLSTQDGLGRAQHAQYAVNTPAQAEEGGKVNQLMLSSKLQNTVKNRFADHSFENGTPWTGGSVTTAAAYMGAKALTVTNGTASKAFTAEAGKTYTFSAYVKTGDQAAYLTLGTAQSTALKANTGWTRLEVSFTAEAAGDITAALVSQGTAYMDCVQLETMPTASRYNLIENGDFTNSLNSWTGSGFSTGAVTAAAPQLDGSAATVTGDPSATRQLTQTVPVSGVAGDNFVLSGWAKGDSVPLRGNRTFAITGTFNYTDGTTGEFIAAFNPDTNAAVQWQYTANVLVAEKDYSSVTVKLCYDYNANTVCFDGIQLFKEAFGAAYTYDEDGNVIAVKDVQGQITSYEYTNNDLTKVISSNGAEMTYTYDAYHNVKTATSSAGYVYSFTYDSYGNNTAVSTTADGSTISSSAAYTADGNYMVSATDALGNTVQYGYDPDTGVLLWTQAPEETQTTRTNYTYDEMYRMATAAATTDTGLAMSVSYTYENDLLTKLQTPSTTYSFTYGDFALRQNVKIGSRTLASYSYTAQNYYLQKLDYGNGDHVQYTYDDYGRLLSQTYENGDTITYQYDNDGALAAFTDSASGITTRQYYDFSGRATGYSETGNDFSHCVFYEYDSKNNMTALVQTIGDTEKTTAYTYDEDNRVSTINADGTTVAYTFDGFGRVSQQVTKNGDTVILTESFTFTQPGENKTSGQVATYRIEAAGKDVLYTYTYDQNGNITGIVENNNITDKTYTLTYEYDSANQLVRENNSRRNKSYTWTYDNAGNITAFNTYAYTTGELGTAEDSVPYTYTDDDWGDLLTSLDGAAISYDEIGNPLSDGTRTFTWQHGRQLASMTKDGVTWTYTYNNAGLRTGRSCGTTSYSYIYDGSKLVQMTCTKNGTTRIADFTYDASGNPLTMKVNGVTYYYAVNLQGDVTGILDGSGTLLLEYSYTAYGQGAARANVVGSTANMLANLNPLLYRGYVLDLGTGLYYLQSRYYDPAVGRFLNADAFASTGQGLTGNNMFAYCLNDPVNLVDYCGYLAYPGEIHNLVVWYIMSHHHLNLEQHIIFSDGTYGRADLVSSSGQVWDVKPNSEFHIQKGVDQVSKYVGGAWYHHEKTKLSVGGWLPSGEFEHRAGDVIYHISYQYARDGVITYDYYCEQIKPDTQVNTNNNFHHDSSLNNYQNQSGMLQQVTFGVAIVAIATVAAYLTSGLSLFLF